MLHGNNLEEHSYINMDEKMETVGMKNFAVSANRCNACKRDLDVKQIKRFAQTKNSMYNEHPFEEFRFRV